MKDRILITGATGFIGTVVKEYLAKNLNQDKFDIFLTTRNKSNDPKSIFIDLEDPSSILDLENSFSFKYIIHLASAIGWNDERNLFTSNILSTGCFAYLCKKWDAKLIFASASIIHGVKSELITQDSNIILDSKYGQSKFSAENLILASEISNCILRISGVYGLDGPDHLQINQAIREAYYNQQVPQNNLANEIKRNYIYVKDLANFILHIIIDDIEGIHLVASPEELTVDQMLVMISGEFTGGQKIKNTNKYSGSNQIVLPSRAMKSFTLFKDSLAEMNKQKSK